MPETNEQPTPKPRDFHQEVTDNIVALLEKGVAPWQKPWDAQSNPAMPVNPTTDRPYRGGNAVHLLAVGMQRNYEDPRWMTYKQATEQGWRVRRGEKGTQIEFWDVRSQRENLADSTRNSGGRTDSEGTKADEPASRLVHRVYTVFNAKQIDGVPALVPKEPQPFEVVQAGEKILVNSRAKIAHDQADRAFYERRKDEIHLPPQQAFKDAAGYYGTALHELGHNADSRIMPRRTLTAAVNVGLPRRQGRHNHRAIGLPVSYALFCNPNRRSTYETTSIE